MITPNIYPLYVLGRLINLSCISKHRLANK